MGLILDTSVLIESERGRLDLERLTAAEAGPEPTAIPSIVASEYLHGWERAQAGKRKQERMAFFEELLRSLPVIPFDLDIARVHADLWANLLRGGIVVGAHDLIIAATCLHLDWHLATANEAEFAQIPALRRIDIRPYASPR